MDLKSDETFEKSGILWEVDRWACSGKVDLVLGPILPLLSGILILKIVINF